MAPETIMSSPRVPGTRPRAMKTIIVTVSVEPKRSVKSRLFGLVEGERFRYRATVKNVGDEPVGSKDQDPDGRVTNLAAIEFVPSPPGRSS